MDLQNAGNWPKSRCSTAARRSLHDDVMPQIHAALLNLGRIQANAGAPISETIELLTQTHRQISEVLRGMPVTGNAEKSAGRAWSPRCAKR